MKILTVIPARGGSKGIPRKNIKPLAGRPMIGYIIATARQVRGVDRVIVSTEDAEIADVARACGAEVPFLRPAELAQDTSNTHVVLQHAVETLAATEDYHPDYVLLLYPTSPLLSVARIQEAVDVVERRGADAVVSGVLDKGHFWHEVEGGWERLYPRKLENRQWSKPLFRENGAIYLTRTSVLRRQIVADKIDIVLMEPGESIDVDTPEDFAAVEARLRAKG